MKIVRAKVVSASADDSWHRVKIQADGLFQDTLADVSNGIYLRKGDMVYVLAKDDYLEPLVLGRCSGQLELSDLVNVINGLVDVFNDHVHSAGTYATSQGPVLDTTYSGKPTTTQSKVKEDDVLYK